MAIAQLLKAEGFVISIEMDITYSQLALTARLDFKYVKNIRVKTRRRADAQTRGRAVGEERS